MDAELAAEAATPGTAGNAFYARYVFPFDSDAIDGQRQIRAPAGQHQGQTNGSQLRIIEITGQSQTNLKIEMSKGKAKHLGSTRDGIDGIQALD